MGGPSVPVAPRMRTWIEDGIAKKACEGATACACVEGACVPRPNLRRDVKNTGIIEGVFILEINCHGFGLRYKGCEVSVLTLRNFAAGTDVADLRY